MRKVYLLLLLSLVFSSVLKAQNRTVTGLVTDEKGAPFPGVSILVKGAPTIVVTDVNGKYSITVTNLQNVVLSARYVGYTYQEKTLRVGEQNADFRMLTSEKDLNEVVVVGYGEQKRENLTGSVQTFDPKKFEDYPFAALTDGLKGQAPGINIGGGDQRPGQPTTPTIRNQVFFSANGQSGGPLFIIDDAIRNQADFDLLDASEVESISVLKDAAAAVYGIQGANGVFLVKTKHGKAGPPKITFSQSFGNSRATQLPKMMSGLQLATYLNDVSVTQQGLAGNTITPDGYINGVVTNKLATWYTPDELAYFAANNNNYLEKAFQTALVERSTMNIQGGTDKATYFIGGDYQNQNSNFSGVNSYKYGLRAGVDATVAKGLKVSMSLSGDYQYTRSYWYKLAGTSESLDNDFLSLTQVPPWQQYFINGQPNLISGTTSGTAANDNINFFAIQQSNNYTEGKTYYINAQAKVTYDIPGVKGLNAYFNYNDNVNFGFPKQYGTQFNYVTYSGTGGNNHIPGGTFVKQQTITNGTRVRINPSYNTSYQLDAGLNYNRTFGKHTISVLAYYEQRETYSEGVAAESDNPIVGGLDNQTFTTGTQSSSQASMISEFGAESYITRVNYSYADKYLFEGVFRADANTYLSPEHQWGYFPSGSAGWIVSKEKFFTDNVKGVDFLKIRASAGLLGSSNIKPYQYLVDYQFATGSSGGASFGSNQARGLGLALNVGIPNTNIAWDSYFKTNYGIDAAFLNNRLTLTADYFWNHGYNMLTTVSSSVAAVVGATTPPENYSSANTFGYELQLGWRDHIGKDWSYNFSPWVAWSDNKYIKYDVSSGIKGTVQDRTGKSSDGGAFGYVYEGMFRTQADVNNYLAIHPGYTIFGQAPAPGMLYYKDLNGDGKITTDLADQQYISNKSSNHYTAGFNFGASWKDLSFSATANLSWGGTGSVEGAAQKLATATENRPVFWADHWTPDNTNAAFPAPYYVSDYNVNSSFWFRSSTTFNISRFNLAYTLPRSIDKMIGVENIRATFNATNPLNLYNPVGYRDNNLSTYAVFPTLKTFTFGLNVSL